MRFFSARLNFDNGIVLKFDGFLVNLFQYKTPAFTERSPSVHGYTAAQHLQRNKCECLKIQTFTPFPLKINGKRGVGEGVNAFYRE